MKIEIHLTMDITPRGMVGVYRSDDMNSDNIMPAVSLRKLVMDMLAGSDQKDADLLYLARTMRKLADEVDAYRKEPTG
jgi:hypothetical protein